MPVEIAAALHESLDTAEALGAAAGEVAERLDGRPDLCLVFLGAPHLGAAEQAISVVDDRLAPASLIGCGAGGVVGPGREVEHGPAAIVWAARLPGARIDTFHATGEAGFEPELPEELDAVPEPSATLLLADPYTFSGEGLLALLDERWPGRPVLGGLASAAIDGGASLLLDGEVVTGGAVGCTISGVDVLPCVSQGAMPVGPEMTITAGEGNVIAELASKPALERIGEVVAALPPTERAQAAAGMLIGVVIDENRPEHQRGDFLVRPVVGADRETGAIAIGEVARVGRTVRLHVRDEESADADLREALAAQVGALGTDGAAGALLFTCNGRGSQMFSTADHDAGAIEEALAVPVGGFFCAGEIGPVGGRNFLHGFTATLAVFPR